MKVFALADVHLSFGVKNKAMDVFGARWENHIQRIEENWKNTVSVGDIVLLNGDISWGMSIKEAEEDIRFLASLPGRKILLRGNHDYWWTGYSKLLHFLPEGMTAVQNNVVSTEGIHIGGTRGWVVPGSSVFKEEEDRKIYEREKLRLHMSLQQMKVGEENIVMLHYPPFHEKDSHSEITEILESYPVKTVLYGHLHGPSGAGAFEGVQNGIEYVFTAADHLNFIPKLIGQY